MSVQPRTAAAMVTADQLLAMPDDGRRRELVEGEVREMSPAGYRHGRIALRIGALVGRHADEHRLGDVLAAETGFRLSRDPDTVRAADVAFVAAHRRPAPADQASFVDLAPDLAVEVVSPSDRAGDVVERALAWLAAGTTAVWVVYPAQRLVVVHTAGGATVHLGGDDVLDGAPVLPRLRVPVADLVD